MTRIISQIQITRTVISSIITVAAEQQEAGRKDKPPAQIMHRYKGGSIPLKPPREGY